MFPLPIYAHLEITDICNLKCIHCFHSGVRVPRKSNDLEEDNLLELVKILIDNKIFVLTLTGGEPFTKPDLTLKILKIAKDAGLHVNINTNGLLLTKEIVEKLINLKVDSLLISCPAGDKRTYQKLTGGGDYQIFKEKLHLVIKSNIHFLINTVVSKSNYKLMRKTAVEMVNSGVKNFALTPATLNLQNPIYDMLLSPDEILELFEILRWTKNQYGIYVDSVEPIPICFFPDWAFESQLPFTRRVCVAGVKSICVSNTGEVRTCAHNDKTYGNLLGKSLSEIWSVMESYRTNRTPNMCLPCPAQEKCNGGCRIFSMAKYGVTNMPDRLMKGPIKQSTTKKTQTKVPLNAIYHFNGKLRYRKEYEGKYSVTSYTNAGNNIMIVNKNLLEYIKWLSISLPQRGIDILSTKQNSEKGKAKIRILSKLLENKFIGYDEP